MKVFAAVIFKNISDDGTKVEVIIMQFLQNFKFSVCLIALVGCHHYRHTLPFQSDRF